MYCLQQASILTGVQGEVGRFGAHSSDCEYTCLTKAHICARAACYRQTARGRLATAAPQRFLETQAASRRPGRSVVIELPWFAAHALSKHT